MYGFNSEKNPAIHYIVPQFIQIMKTNGIWKQKVKYEKAWKLWKETVVCILSPKK